MPRAVLRHSLCLSLSLAASAAFADQPDTPAVPAAAEDVIMVTYRCESSQTVIARYDNTDPDAPTARLQYRGRTFEMYNVRAASGARYATEQGLSPDKGLQWWTKGDDATLSEMLMDHTAPEAVEIEACTAEPAG
ncbi:MliC family protein [Mesorhizobium sp. WSM2239]|uniref:MliC family protein n=2 Tax=unclassified Mesorhizobium TaxID=325217 RepID=A0AAU8D826_9HYPH